MGGPLHEFETPGLRRIDRVTGAVSLLDDTKDEDQYGREDCGGFMNPNCVSVDDIAEEPWRPGCSLVAAGSSGLVQSQLWEVCDGRVQRGFASLVTEMNHPRPDGAPLAAVHFVRLSRSGNDVWGATFEGLYRFNGSLVPTFVPFPSFERIEDLWVSFELPGLALVAQARDATDAPFSFPLLLPRG